MEGPEIKAVEAVIDNGSFGKRTLRFETGRLAQQADGAVAAYLDDDSMILSTTTAGSSPKVSMHEPTSLSAYFIFFITGPLCFLEYFLIFSPVSC